MRVLFYAEDILKGIIRLRFRLGLVKVRARQAEVMVEVSRSVQRIHIMSCEVMKTRLFIRLCYCKFQVW